MCITIELIKERDFQVGRSPFVILDHFSWENKGQKVTLSESNKNAGIF